MIPTLITVERQKEKIIENFISSFATVFEIILFLGGYRVASELSAKNFGSEINVCKTLQKCELENSQLANWRNVDFLYRIHRDSFLRHSSLVNSNHIHCR